MNKKQKLDRLQEEVIEAMGMLSKLRQLDVLKQVYKLLEEEVEEAIEEIRLLETKN